MSTNPKVLPEEDCAMAAFKKPTESGDGGGHQSPSLLKGRIVGLLRVIEQGFRPDPLGMMTVVGPSSPDCLGASFEAGL